MPVRPFHEQRVALLAVALLATPILSKASAQLPPSTPDSVARISRSASPTTGASIAVIDSADIAASGARTLSELLTARVPGLSVRPRGGTEPDGAEVSSRGGIAVAGATPLLVIDGIVADSRQALFVPGTSVAPSRLDDLAPADIQRIEVLRGPAAGALYGFGAGGGVIVVTTRRPGTGPLHLDVAGSAGLTDLRADFPANYQLVNSAHQPCNPRVGPFPTAASCAPTSLDSWNPLEQASPFRVGRSVSGGAALSGAALGLGLSAGLSGERTNGVTEDDRQSRIAMRGSVERALPGHLTVSARGTYVRRDATAPTRGVVANSYESVIARGLTGSAYDDSVHGYSTRFANTGTTVGLPEPSLSRLTSALRLGWTPLAWLTVDALGGQDRTRESARRTYATRTPTGTVNDVTSNNDRWTSGTMHVGAEARYGAGVGLALATYVGYDDVRTHDDAADTSAAVANGGIVSGQWGLTRSWQRRQEATLRQQLAWRDVLTMSAGTRSPVGRGIVAPFGVWGSRNVDASVRLPSPRSDVALRLRAAAGVAPLVAPGSGYFIEAPITIGPGGNGSGTTVVPFRSRQGEREVGIDADFGTRSRLEVTYFSTKSVDAIVGSMPRPGLGGFTTVPVLTDFTNRGVEVTASAQLLQRARVGWRSTVTLATLRNEIQQISSPWVSQNGEARAGFPLQGYWASGYRWTDANADGLISSREVTGDATRSYVGPSRPTLEVGMQNTVTLPRGISLSALLDYRGGQYRENQTEAVRCVLGICQGMQDPSLSLADQARWSALYQLRVRDVVPSSFMRVREVVLQWSPPRTDAVGARALAVRVVGQNLLTWTRYTGIDPEVGDTSLNPGLAVSEMMQSPLTRRVRVELRMGVM